MGAEHGLGAVRRGDLADRVDLGLAVRGEMVDRDHGRHAELADILDMAGEVDAAGLHRRDIFLAEVGAGDAAIIFERAYGGDDDGGGGVSPAWRHLMSKNFSAPRSAPKPASVTT